MNSEKVESCSRRMDAGNIKLCATWPLDISRPPLPAMYAFRGPPSVHADDKVWQHPRATTHVCPSYPFSCSTALRRPQYEAPHPNQGGDIDIMSEVTLGFRQEFRIAGGND